MEAFSINWKSNHTFNSNVSTGRVQLLQTSLFFPLFFLPFGQEVTFNDSIIHEITACMPLFLVAGIVMDFEKGFYQKPYWVYRNASSIIHFPAIPVDQLSSVLHFPRTVSFPHVYMHEWRIAFSRERQELVGLAMIKDGCDHSHSGADLLLSEPPVCTHM